MEQSRQNLRLYKKQSAIITELASHYKHNSWWRRSVLYAHSIISHQAKSLEPFAAALDCLDGTVFMPCLQTPSQCAETYRRKFNPGTDLTCAELHELSTALLVCVECRWKAPFAWENVSFGGLRNRRCLVSLARLAFNQALYHSWMVKFFNSSPPHLFFSNTFGFKNDEHFI